jgi:hypothetical protein
MAISKHGSKEAPKKNASAASDTSVTKVADAKGVIDFQYWLGMPYLTLQEAISLSLGVDPKKKQRLHPKPGTPFGNHYIKRHEMLSRAANSAELALECHDNVNLGVMIPPAVFANWAIGEGWDLPKEVTALIKKRRKKKGPVDALATNATWTHLESVARKAIGAYPEWRDSQKPTIQEVVDWLAESYKLNTRECQLIKDVLADHFTEFP